MGYLISIAIVFLISLSLWRGAPFWFHIIYTLIYSVILFFFRWLMRASLNSPESGAHQLGRLRGIVAFALTYGILSLFMNGTPFGSFAFNTSIAKNGIETTPPVLVATLTTDEQTTVLHRDGLSHMETEDYQGAIDSFTKAIQLDSSCAPCYEMRGWCYGQKGEYELALVDYNSAIQLEPNIASAYNGRGRIYHFQNQFDAAILDFTRAIEIEPSDATYYCNRGTSYNRTNKYEIAITDLTEAVNRGSDLIISQAAYERAWAYHMIGRDDLARVDLNRCLELDISPAQIEQVQNALRALQE